MSFEDKDSLEIEAVWLQQYRDLAAATSAQGLSQRFTQAAPQVQRRAFIVELFWIVRNGLPSPDTGLQLDAAAEACIGDGDIRYAAIAHYAHALERGRHDAFAMAIEYGRKALQLCEALAEPPRLEFAIFLNGVGSWHKQLGQWSEALEPLYRAEHLAMTLDAPGVLASIRSNIGAVFFSSGNLEDSLERFIQAWELAKPAGMDQLFGVLGSNVARTYAGLGRWEEARAWVTPLLAGETSATRWGAWMWAIGARACAALGDAALARQWADEALRVAATRHRSEETIQALLADGHAHLAQGHGMAARTVFLQVEGLVGKDGDPMYQLDIAEGQAHAARLLGDAAEAARALETTLSLRERLAGTAARTRVVALKIREHVDELAKQRDQAFQAQAQAEQALAALKTAQAQLLQAQQRAMANQLMTSLAHQLNTPLGICLTAASTQQERFAEMGHALRAGNLRRSELDQFMQVGYSSAALVTDNLERLRRLVERFRRFSVHRLLTLESLPDVVGEALQNARIRHRLAEPDVLNAEMAPLKLVCDREALIGLLAELVDNALKAKRAGDPAIVVRAAAQGDDILLQVVDGGPGISPEQLSQAKNPYRARSGAEEFNGLGLGWPIIHHLAEQVLNAKVNIASSHSTGTTVNILLPYRPCPEETGGSSS